jgi:hypothetical protein
MVWQGRHTNWWHVVGLEEGLRERIANYYRASERERVLAECWRCGHGEKQHEDTLSHGSRDDHAFNCGCERFESRASALARLPKVQRVLDYWEQLASDGLKTQLAAEERVRELEAALHLADDHVFCECILNLTQPDLLCEPHRVIRAALTPAAGAADAD